MGARAAQREGVGARVTQREEDRRKDRGGRGRVGAQGGGFSRGVCGRLGKVPRAIGCPLHLQHARTPQIFNV